ncbi:hypothetical protein ES319_D03G100000v1 [Gossypium barbadense]|uniref:P-type ATPase C-terminal domain-containing protein n=2 Tax=Gossypium TaxID=3633 RepID=A0A5J5S397_GOSBA|nr:hypothetical protein ES319_D03G100000v1 [Gossypium barbadense]KAB2037767.1 hypothetical protein ES319_D03G100000v1 [Gossypium barbadense]KAB2037768.1 hypothetical protein ES319_D03G100000v1 [Gossypium barbadense]TYG76350.1 hypothetical protein ES288_D03G108600v1 [Gossypium darwinii]
MGSLWTIAVVILVNIRLAMDIRRWVFITHAAVWGSIIITYACMVVLDSIPVFPNYWTIYHLVKSPTYWLTIQHGKKKERNAARYMTRSQAIKILQVSFRISVISVAFKTQINSWNSSIYSTRSSGAARV